MCVIVQKKYDLLMLLIAYRAAELHVMCWSILLKWELK